MKKTLFITLFTLIITILSACATPSTATPTLSPSPTLFPTATPTPLPPTPDVGGLILSGEILATSKDGIPRYTLTDANWLPIPPEDLRDELSTLEGWNYTRHTKGDLQIIDIEGTHLWLETGGFWTVLPTDLPKNWVLNNEKTSIIDAKTNQELYTLDTEKTKWIKKFLLQPDIYKFQENFIPIEDFQSGDFRRWAESLVKPEDFNLEKMIPVADMKNYGIGIVQKSKSEGNFNDSERAFFKREITFAYTEYTTKEDVQPPFKPDMKLPYLVMPTWNYYKGKTYLEIKFHPLYDIYYGEIYNFDHDQIKLFLDTWKNKMNVTSPKSNANLSWATDKDGHHSGFEDPFIAETFNNPNLNMNERMDRYCYDDDLSALSGSDETGEIFLITTIADTFLFR